VSVSREGCTGWGAGLVALVGALAALLVFAAAAPAADFVIAGSRTSTGIPLVRTFADNTPGPDGVYEKLVDEVVPYKTSVGDPVRVAAGDFNGDGNDELVVATDKATPVKIFELSSDGEPGARIDTEPGFAHGTYVAAGDVNGDGVDELITSGGPGDHEVVKIRSDLDGDGKPDDVTDTFNAYPAARPGGVRVAAGNVGNSGGDEVITAPGPGDKLPVKVFSDSDADRAVSDNPLEDQLKPFGDAFAGGMFVASGAFQNAGNGGSEVVVSRADSTGKTVIRTDSDSDGKVSDNPPFDQIASAYPGSTKGARIAAGDTDHSGFFTELITAPGEKTGTNPVKIYDDNGDAGDKISDNPVTQSFTAFGGNQGAYVGFARVPSNSFYVNSFPQTIADLSTLNSTIPVPGSAGIVRDLDVSINIFHSFDGDLDVTLTHVPTGTSVILFQDVGGTNEGFEIRLNDDAGTDISGASNPKVDGPITGTFNPGGAALLSAFDGEDASGKWQLSVTDDTSGDTGTLMSWGLNVTY
jgi:subtilisin-like proprotein convertase family protein